MNPSRVDFDVLDACAVHFTNRGEEGPGPVDCGEAECVSREDGTTVCFVVDGSACLEKCYAKQGGCFIFRWAASNDGIDDGFICSEAVAVDDVFYLGWEAKYWGLELAVLRRSDNEGRHVEVGMGIGVK